MERIEWNSSFSVGVARLDEQHQRVVHMINRLIEAPGATVRSETISDLLGDLTRYAREHFRTEEQLMEEHGYPDLAPHKEEHRTYRVKIVAFCRAAMVHEDAVPAELLHFMRDWWLQHILEADMKFRDFFVERGVR